ncbi:MAG: M17 family peptidase N-terminal domain-containing protein [Candidatus Methylomirabilales bacterium]
MTPPPVDPVEEVRGEVLVLFHYEDIPVPRHTLGKVDWYLAGAVSRLAVDGKFTGGVGSVALFHPSGKFQVEKILVLGLGPRAGVNPSTLQSAARHLQSLLHDLHARDVRIVVPDSPDTRVHEVIDLFSATLRTLGESAAPPTITFLAYEDEGRPGSWRQGR